MALRLPKILTEALVERLNEDLVLDPSTEPCRKFLESRKLWRPEIVDRLRVGAIEDVLIFPQYDEGGLKDRYRTYLIGAGKANRWGWSIGTGPTQGLWPGNIIAPEGAKIWIFEGEWDAWTGISRLDLWEAGVYSYTYTGGASTSVHPSLVPDWLRGRELHLCYDNDVYQGREWGQHRAPDDRSLAGMRQRREAFLKTARALSANRCAVFTHAIPVDPLLKWGGDFRDWVDAGGRNLDEIPFDHLKDVLACDDVVVQATTVSQVAMEAGSRVRFRAQVQSVEEDGVVCPMTVQLDCEMGQRRICKDCMAPTVAPDKVIDLSEHLDVLAEAMVGRNLEETILRKLLGKPGSCPRARIVPSDYQMVKRWGAQSEREGDQEVTVLSADPPNLSGETEVEGSVHHVDRSIVVLASRTVHVDRPLPDLAQHLYLLRDLSPPPRPNSTQIRDHLTQRAAFLAAEVTKNYGRSNLHLLTDLLYHSVLWIRVDGHKRRGWMDVGIIGDTASGKTSTVHRISEWLKLGGLYTCADNVSRAGLTMGAVRANGSGGYRQKPGLFPRNHGKLLALDEFHILVEEGGQGEGSPMMHLQAARDLGIVEGVKVYGTRRLDAAVRLMTISNWLFGGIESHKFPCEHFGPLYGRPEMLRRMDIGLCVTGDPTSMAVPQWRDPNKQSVWTQAAWRTLVLRAWAITEDNVVIEPDAITYAQDIASVWKDIYNEDLALFTYAEKPLSLLRVAAAASCACLSYPEGESMKCLVTKEHVEYARLLFEEVWTDMGYEQWSQSRIRMKILARPVGVERLLTAELNLFDSADALQVLGRLFAPMSKQEMCTYTGKDMMQTEKWANEMVRMGALEPCMARNRWHKEWKITTGAFRILKNLVVMASEFPEVYEQRVGRIAQWKGQKEQLEKENGNLLCSEEEVRSRFGG